MKKTKKEQVTPENEVDQPVVEPTEQACTTDKMTEEAIDWQDKYVRLSAEFDNFRKRTLKEKADLALYGGAEVLKTMLSTADDFDRALAHITNETDRQGVELIYGKFIAALTAKGVVAMDLVGKPFDVDTAEAIAKLPAPSQELKGTVMDQTEKGYMLKDRVLRFAKVVVYEG